MANERICIGKLFVTRQAAVDTFARNVKRGLNNLIIQIKSSEKTTENNNINNNKKNNNISSSNNNNINNNNNTKAKNEGFKINLSTFEKWEI
jgi:hypothetical protein